MNTKSTETPPVCSYEGSDYQRTFWDSGERAYEDAVEQIALKRLLTQPGKLLLELGAGAGRNTPRYTGFERVVLLDYSRTQLLQARQRLGNDPRYLFVAADIYKLPFVDGLFDGATMIRTLHHMRSPFSACERPAGITRTRSSCWNSPTNATSSPSALSSAVRS
jgi:SAM-dependent methyltransferase